MKRSLGMERTFTLGAYKNIKVSDVISDVPEDLMLRDDVVSALRTLQILRLDKVYLSYLEKSVTMRGYEFNTPTSIEDALAEVNDAQVTTFESLKEAIASVTKPEKESGEMTDGFTKTEQKEQ